MLIFVTAVAVVLVVSFLCSIFESVLLSMSHAQVQALTERHAHAGRLLLAFKRRIDIPIAAILILNTAAHTIGAAVAGASYTDVFDERSLWIFTVVFTLAVLLFTEIVPKTLGVTHASRLATPVAYGIRLLTIALKPLVVLSERISRRLRGGREVPLTSVEEIRMLTSLGRHEGIVGVRTAGIIEGATLLRKIRAINVMIPRQQVIYLSGKDSWEEIEKKLSGARFSRFPFSPTGDIDDVSGIVLTKELLFWMHGHPDTPLDWSAVCIEPLVVPETQRLDLLLRTFQAERRHMAIVVDEYGSIQGVVTLEDVIEEIVGEIEDESDEPARDIRRQPDGSWLVRASTDLRRVCSALGIDWLPDTEFVTLGGLVSGVLDRIPVSGDSFSWRGFRIQVLKADSRRARLIRVDPDIAGRK